MFVDRRGTLWVGTGRGVFRRPAGEDAFLPFSSVSDVSAFSEDKSGDLWVTDPNSGFRRLEGTNAMDQAALRQQVQGSRLHHDGEGGLWLGTTSQGLFRVSRTPNGVMADRFGIEDGLTNQTVWSVMTDREGSVWVGTQNGLNQLTKSVIGMLPSAGDAGMNAFVRAVAASSDGSVWVGTADGLYRFAGTARTRFDQRHGLPSASILTIHAGNGSQVWVATTRGVAALTNGRFSSLPLQQGVSLNHVSLMTMDSSGGLWLSDSDAGLFRWDTDKLIHVSHPEERFASSLFSDGQGRVWIGFLGGGLAKYENGAFRSYDSADAVARGAITNFYEDSSGTLWIAANGGLSWLRGNDFRTATTTNGLPGNAVSAITEDHDGRIWLGMKSGIVRVTKTEFANIDAEPAYQLRPTLFASADGVRGNPIALGTPVARATDGTLWFATSAGVAIVNPRVAEQRRIPPPVVIEAVNVDDTRINHTDAGALPARVGRVGIDYTALSYVTPSRVRFRYRLDGYDKDWIDAGNQRYAVYTALPPGSYRFRVIAGQDGVWNETGAEWAFSVAPMFYQTGLFQIASAMGFVVVIGAVWRLRLRHVRNRLLLVVEERARVAREVHDTLLQTMLGAALEIETVTAGISREHDSVRKRLVHLREQLQRSIRDTRQSIWDLRSPIVLERTGLATALKQACQAIGSDSNAIRIEFSVVGTPRRIAKVDEELLSLGQEGVRNAVRHAGARLVTVQLSYLTDSVSLKIIDDGHGFDRRDVVGGYGLAIMEERANKIGATFSVLSRLGVGTEIETVVRR